MYKEQQIIVPVSSRLATNQFSIAEVSIIKRLSNH